MAVLCYIASNAISHLTDWKIYFDLANKNKDISELSKMATDSIQQLSQTRKEYEDEINGKEEKLYNDMIEYLSALKKLFKQEFYLKFDFIAKTEKPEA